MTVKTASGTKFYIGPQITDSTDTAGEYSALVYTEVKEVESYGEFGDSANPVTFAAVGDARVRKGKGARDAGNMALVVGRDPLDPGQIALAAAEKTNKEYAVKVVLADAPTDLYTNTTFYMRVLVMSAPNNVGNNDNIVRRTFNLGINSEVIEVPAALIP